MGDCRFRAAYLWVMQWIIGLVVFFVFSFFLFSASYSLCVFMRWNANGPA